MQFNEQDLNLEFSGGMKSKAEITYVHDMLSSLIKNDEAADEIDLTESDVMALRLARAVLCWVLLHENNVFNELIKELEERLADNGYAMRESDMDEE